MKTGEGKTLSVINSRTLKTLEIIETESKPLIDRISKDGYVMNDHDNREMRMRIDALKSIRHSC